MLRNTTRWFALVYFSAAVIALASLALGPIGVTTILSLAAAPVFALLGVRMLRSAILIDDDGVAARADRFAKHLKWPDVNRFELRARAGGFGRALGAWKNDGTWVHLMDGGLDSKNAYGKAFAMLQSALSQRRPDQAIADS